MSSEESGGCLFNWRIENFSFCHHENGACLLSPLFVPEGSDTRWFILLSPRGHYDTESNISICLWRGKAGKEIDANEVSINYRIELIGPSGKVLDSYEEKIVAPDNFSSRLDFIDIGVVIKDIEATNRDIITVSCHIYDINSIKLESSTCEAYTKIEINKQSFRWNIASEQDTTTEECVSLPGIAEFSIELRKIKNIIKLFIRRKKVMLSSSHFVELRLSLLAVNGKKAHSLKATHFFDFKYDEDEGDDDWEFPLFLQTNYKRCNVINGFLVFLCEFSCSGEFIIDNTNSLLAHNTKCDTNVFSTLHENLYDMFCNKKYCDVKLRVSDEVIEAHRCVLAAQSPVFSAMFDQDMIEAQTGVVEISDLDVCTLKSFLKYLYTDTVDDMDYESATNLIMVANKYQILPLKGKCAIFLESLLSVENACEVAKLADMVCHNELKTLALNFIVANSKTILTMPEWISWMKCNMELATEIFSKFTEVLTLS